MLWSSAVQYSVCEFEAERSLIAPIDVISISILPQHYLSTRASSRFFNLVWCNKLFANFKRRVLSQLQHMLVYQSCRNIYIYSACVSSQFYDPVWRKIVTAILKGDFSNISNICMYINPALTLHIDMCFFSMLWSSFMEDSFWKKSSLTAPIYVSISILSQPYISTCVASPSCNPVQCKILFAILKEELSHSSVYVGNSILSQPVFRGVLHASVMQESVCDLEGRVLV